MVVGRKNYRPSLEVSEKVGDQSTSPDELRFGVRKIVGRARLAPASLEHLSVIIGSNWDRGLERQKFRVHARLVKFQQRYEKRLGVWATLFAPRPYAQVVPPIYRADSSGEFWELQNWRNSLKNRML